MRRFGVVSAGFVVSLALVAAVPASATAAPRLHVAASLEVSVGLFRGELAPYGDWVEVEDYGPAWVPHVRHGWRPYTVGYWAWTEDYGWLWVSDEPFGWAVFHYGRWYPSPRYGWVWIPAYDWAPAWVAFRIGDGYAGWAPLPPAVDWEVGVGFRVGTADFDRYVDPRAYCFVPEREFLDPVRPHVLPVERNAVLFRATRNVTSYAGAGGRIVNRGIPVERIREATHRPVTGARVVDVGSAAAARRARAGRGEVPVFRPSARGDGRVVGRERVRPSEGARQVEARQRAEARQEAARQRALEKERERDRRVAQSNLARDHQRQEAERRQLERRQQRERTDLERQHQQEVRHPPRGVAIEQLARRQEEQHRGLEERQIRERQQALQQRTRQRSEAGRRQAAARPQARVQTEKGKRASGEKSGDRKNARPDRG